MILAGAKSNHRFAGRHGYYKDDNSGLSLLGARYYSALLGRFLTQDSIGHGGGLNLYRYCSDSPLTNVDPDGRDGLNILGFEFNSEVLKTGVMTGLSAVGESFSFGRWRNEYFASMPGYGVSRGFGDAGRDILITAGTMGAGAYIQSTRGTITVYQSINATTQSVQYVGITNSLARRTVEHAGRFAIKAIENLPKLTPKQARAVEQVLIEHHGLMKNGGTLLNKINSIAKTNPEYAKALRTGAALLKKAKYPGF